MIIIICRVAATQWVVGLAALIAACSASDDRTPDAETTRVPDVNAVAADASVDATTAAPDAAPPSGTVELYVGQLKSGTGYYAFLYPKMFREVPRVRCTSRVVEGPCRVSDCVIVTPGRPDDRGQRVAGGVVEVLVNGHVALSASPTPSGTYDFIQQTRFQPLWRDGQQIEVRHRGPGPAGVPDFSVTATASAGVILSQPTFGLDTDRQTLPLDRSQDFALAWTPPPSKAGQMHLSIGEVTPASVDPKFDGVVYDEINCDFPLGDESGIVPSLLLSLLNDVHEHAANDGIGMLAAQAQSSVHAEVAGWNIELLVEQDAVTPEGRPANPVWVRFD